MTKQTNYVATVTDANSVFPPKGEAIPNSDRGLITATAGQREGSVGAKDSWFIDTNAEPLASYPNNRLPRWQDLIPLSCDFTFSVIQVPTAPPATLDSSTAINLFFDSSGSMDQVLPTLQYMASTILKPCLLPFYNNDSNLYNQRVKVTSINTERTIQWLGTQPSSGATKVVNMAFSDEAIPLYVNPGGFLYPNGTPINVTATCIPEPCRFLPNNPPTQEYVSDISLANSRLASNLRGIIYRINRGIAPNDPEDKIMKEFYQAVFTGQGQYSGVAGFSANVYTTLMDDVLALPNTPQNAQYYANKVIEGLNIIGYTLTYC
jgi:hypothetical protein